MIDFDDLNLKVSLILVIFIEKSFITSASGLVPYSV